MTADLIPTLSVLLPCHNEEAMLADQLERIVSQLSEHDELVLVDDGSTDRTIKVMGPYWAHPSVRGIRRAHPEGVNAAFNFCFSRSTKQWVLGASGNDRVQPGAIAAWRRAATAWPTARVIMGREAKGGHCDTEPALYTPDELRVKWRQWHGHRIDGCATFLHRDAWGRGYECGEWLADWWQIFQAVCRFGIGHIPEIISAMGPQGYSAQHSNDARYNRAMAEIRAVAYSELCDDIRPMLDDYQSFSHFLDFRERTVWFERKSGSKVQT